MFAMEVGQVYCDLCAAKFEPAVQEVEGHIFFDCPKCAKRFTICRITPRGIELREALNREREKFFQMRSASFKEYTLREIEQQGAKVERLLEEFRKECSTE